MPRALVVDADPVAAARLVALLVAQGWKGRVAGSLGQALQAGFEAGGINVIVARTECRSNVVVHDEIHAAVAAFLEAAGHRAA